jgi:transposase
MPKHTKKKVTHEKGVKGKKAKNGTLFSATKKRNSARSKIRPKKKIQKDRRGRKPYFSEEEKQTLRVIVDKRLRLDKKITRTIIAQKFEKKTGRKITHLQRLSDIRHELGSSWQKLQPRSRRQAQASTQARVDVFLKKERRNARRRQWFVDQIKLPDGEVIGRGYGVPGKGAYVTPTSTSTGTGTGIMSCNWEAGMGPYSYVRNDTSGTTREDMMKYFKKLRKVMNPGDILYLDNAKINQDKTFHSIEAFFAKKDIIVRYLPPNSTHLCSPLDQQPFAVLRNLWAAQEGKKAKTAKSALKKSVSGVSLACVRKGIKSAGF